MTHPLQRQIDELKIGQTAQKQYGLNSNLPNDFIEFLGKYNEYWWMCDPTSTDTISQTFYEHSTDRNAYPDSGTVDGITYTYLGVPFDDLRSISVSKIDIMSYTGTGQYGSSNPTTINFARKPIAFIIRGDETLIISTNFDTQLTFVISSYNGLAFPITYLSWNGTQVKLYCESGLHPARFQANTGGKIFHVIAFYR